MIAVVDTNVLVSGLLKVHTAPARIVDMILIERLTCVFDDRILAEYREVLRRPKFRHAISDHEREDVLAFIRAKGHHVVAAPLDLAAAPPDIDDLPFAEAAVAGGAAAIITGNAGHFGFFLNNPWRIKVLSPAEAIPLFC